MNKQLSDLVTVPIDEAEALRIAAHCKPVDVVDGNLEGMIYLALRSAYWRGFKDGKAVEQQARDA